MTDRSGSRQKKIGIFGGTLNPIHFGHLRAAEEVHEGLALDQVWFLPAFVPPHKADRNLTSFIHRIRMAELAVEGISHFRVSGLEAERQGPSYSVDTLAELSCRAGEPLRLFFMVGSDAFLEITSWKDYQRLPVLSELVVIARPPDSEQKIAAGIKRMFPDFYPDMDRPGLFLSAQGGRIRIVHSTHLEISSTDIRKRVRSGLSVRFLVPEKVRSYMVINNLYVSSIGRADKQGSDADRPAQALSDMEMLNSILEEIENNKGEDTCVLDMRDISPIADFFVIAQGRSTRHVQGMASKMKKDLSRKGIKCHSVEGEVEGKWILMDFEDIVVHLFYKSVRSFYDLEGLWSEAPRFTPERDRSDHN